MQAVTRKPEPVLSIIPTHVFKRAFVSADRVFRDIDMKIPVK